MSESTASIVFHVSSTTDLSDIETIESSDTESLQRNILTRYEYVSVTINIDDILMISKGYSECYRTQGKFFPIDSPDAERRMYGFNKRLPRNLRYSDHSVGSILFTLISRILNVLDLFHRDRCLFSDVYFSANSNSFLCTLERTSRRFIKTLLSTVLCML